MKRKKRRRSEGRLSQKIKDGKKDKKKKRRKFVKVRRKVGEEKSVLPEYTGSV